MSKLLYELEDAVVDAWPAADTEELDGWLLRATSGPTHRGNSISTLNPGSQLELVERIERAERWYRARGLPPMFQVGPCVSPSDLDAVLEGRGYRKEGEAACAVASPVEVLAATKQGRFEASVAARASDSWRGLAVSASRFAACPEALLGVLSRLGTRCRYALARDAKGEPLACALGISSEDRLGVYAMLTLPVQRRKGASRALLHALAQSALAEGMSELYLLVELENVAARALYQASGFCDVYRYHYRVLDG
jgi:GNAT superfamily N-acetyltransferase